MLRKLGIFVAAIMLANTLYAQQVNLEEIGNIKKNKPIKFNGGLSSGSIFYNGSQQGRQPWTWYVNGNLNMNIYGQINIPVSVNLTNLGADLSYPSLPNRLSIHPTYKWATAHIGDVAMTFSPYTLNGHQFTGGGVDLTPGKWKISAMGGQLLKKVDYSTENPSLMPNYKRMGLGAKVQYDDAKYSVGMIYFAAKDYENTDNTRLMDSMGITPKQNSVLSWNGSLNIVKNLTLQAEYAISFMTRDQRSPQKSDWFFDDIIGRKASTSTYHALNARLNYQLMKNTIGLGYERIDPEYQTLGAYYFNHDYENITLNFARPLLKDDKANVAVSLGVQRDNLDNTKEETSNRYVGSINLNYNPSEDIQTTLNFSTFQSYRNIKSQFDYINEMSPYDNMDTLRFSQLSQNLDGSIMYTFKKNEKQNQRISLNLSYQEAADRQGGISLPGGVSRFVNSALGYNLMLIPKAINISTSFNTTYSYAGMEESYTLGPMAGVTASFFKKTLTTGASSSYNVNIHEGEARAKVLNCRVNASYRVKKKHNLNANIVWQNRNRLNRKDNAWITTDDVTTTIGYSYSF